MNGTAAADWPVAAKEFIGPLLKELAVTRVVLVDDEVGKVTPGVVKQAEVPQLGDVKWDRKKEDYEAFFEREWGGLDGAQQRLAQDRAIKKRPDLVAGEIDVMRAIFGDVKWSAVDPEVWRAESVLGDDEIGQTLVFFDLDLGAKGGPQGGAELLRAHLDGSTDARGVLLTSTVRADEELEIPESVAQAVGRPAGEVLLASKDHLTRERSAEFPDLVRRSLTFESLRTMRTQVVAALQHAYGKALQRFEDLPLRAVEDIVVRASRSEGVWEVDTYLRIFAILHREALYQRVRGPGDTKLREAIAVARRVAQIVPHANYQPSEELVTGLMASENYAAGSLINEAGLPVENGDIFDVDGQEYIVIMQACDLMFRDDGSGVRDQIMLARILPVGWDPEGNARRRGAPLPPGLSAAVDPATARSEATGAYVVDFPAVRHLSLELLDLCSFDPRGRARMDIREKEAPIPPLVPGQHERFDDLAAKALRSARSKRVGGTRIYLNTDGDLSVSPRWASNASILNFRLRRIARLGELHATELLNAFAQDASRPADLPPLDGFS